MAEGYQLPPKEPLWVIRLDNAKDIHQMFTNGYNLQKLSKEQLQEIYFHVGVELQERDPNNGPEGEKNADHTS